MVTVDTNTIGVVADYATFALYQTGERTNLVTADKIARAAFKDELHTANISVAGAWTTDATRYIWLDAENAAAQHDGIAGTGARIVTDNNVPMILQEAEHVHVTWLEFDDTTPNNSRPSIRINSAGASGAFLHMDHLILHNLGMGFFIQTGTNDCTVDLINSFIYNSNRIGIRLDGTGHTVRIYSNVVWNVGRQGSGHSALAIVSPTTTAVDLRDMLMHVGHASANVLDLTGAGDPWDVGCDQNILSDGSGTTESLPGDKIESATFQAGTGGSGTRVMFENLTASSEDLHILDDANNSAQDFGNNLTAETFPENIFIARDIDDVLRPATGPWDAGAHQKTVVSAATRIRDIIGRGGVVPFRR